MNKEKLITLFKQCCDSNLRKGKILSREPSEIDTGDLEFKHPTDDHQVDEKLASILTEGGYEFFKKSNFYESYEQKFSYRDIGKTRKFEFDSNPPLVLIPRGVQYDVSLSIDEIIYGNVKKIKSGVSTVVSYKKNFFGRNVKIEKKEPIFLEYREIEFQDSDFIKKIELEKGCHFQIKRKPRYIVTGYFNQFSNFHKELLQDNLGHSNYAHVSQNLFNGEKQTKEEMSIYSSTTKSDINFLDYKLTVFGAIISFGELWSWISYDELMELEAYFMDCLKMNHQKILDKRINETKDI